VRAIGGEQLLKRVLVVAAVALVVAIFAAYVLRPETGAPAGAPTSDEMADALGAALMTHLKRGHVPGRSGELLTVPLPHRYFVGEWDLTTLGTSTPWLASSHPNPWSYTARVPIILYGPGYAPQGMEVTEATDIASLAPTYAGLLGLDGFEADGEPLEAILDQGSQEQKPPKVIFNFIMDGGGWNVLENYANAWPTIKALGKGGTTYMNATIGSAPSITGALHATFGTGSYPLEHGMPGNQLRGADGVPIDAWLQDADPRYLEIPTVSELWDEETDNEATVATVSYEGWHLGMIGHGAYREGGDKDVAALWEAGDNEWWINGDFYELPGALAETDLDRLESYEERLDERDGAVDGTWFDHTPEELKEETTRPGTPAFVKFTGDAIIDTMREYKIGSDDVTDLMWVEMKMPDFAGHLWNMSGPEVGDVLAATDAQLARIKKELDKTVGEGNYLIAISADHGQQPLPELNGGWRINTSEFERDVEARFGNVVEKVTTVDLFLDADALSSEGVDPADIASYIGTYTLGENIPDGAAGADLVPEGRRDEPLFAGAFTTEYLQSLTPETIASFGDGDYSEADFSVAGGNEQ